MNQDTPKLIGQTLNGMNVERDAIHIAVFPAIVGNDSLLGRPWVKIVGNVAYSASRESYDGIIDPFLDINDAYNLGRGDKVWVFLRPGTVTGLTHHWGHPTIGKEIPVSDHEQWIRDFAAKWNFDYNDLIESASALSETAWDNHITAQGHDLHSAKELGEDHDLFWSHLEALKGQSFSQEHRERFSWSCSC